MDNTLFNVTENITTNYEDYFNGKIKKKSIVTCYSKGNISDIKNLPIFDFKLGYRYDKEKIDQIVNLLMLDIDENDPYLQQHYFELLDKIIDGIVNIRYMLDKSSFRFPSVVELNDTIISYFVESENNLTPLIERILGFVEFELSAQYITDNINRLYNIYCEDKQLKPEQTNNFYNKILNQHRNKYLSKEKVNVVGSVLDKLDVTDKKRILIHNSKKLNKISYLIREGMFSNLGTTKDELLEMFNLVKNDIMNNKDIKKSNVNLNDEVWKYLEKQFFENGCLTSYNFYVDLDISNNEVSKFIINKFEKMKMKFFYKIELTEEEQVITEFDKKKLGLNYSNFVISSRKRYFDNMASLLLKLDSDTIDDVLENGEGLNEIKQIIPLIGLVPGVDNDLLVNILRNYSRVKDRILLNIDDTSSSNIEGKLMSRFDEIITFSNAYASSDDLSLFCLGSNLLSSIETHEASKYLEFYCKVINKEKGNIPPISTKSNFLKFESGKYADPDRLLIGKVCAYSCIDLTNIAGGRTFEEALLGDNGDVILVKDNDNNIVSRILAFRRGNVIQLVSPASKRFSYDTYQEIAYQIMGRAVYSNDNIDYVFVSDSSLKGDKKDYRRVEDYRFVKKFPHADTTYSSVLVCSKEQFINNDSGAIHLDFNVSPTASYEKIRMDINYSPDDEDITRLKALSISLEKDTDKKENMARCFEPIKVSNYKDIVCGEDWYVGVKFDGTYDELKLPTSDIRKEIEIRKVKIELGLEQGNQNIGSNRR